MSRKRHNSNYLPIFLAIIAVCIMAFFIFSQKIETAAAQTKNQNITITEIELAETSENQDKINQTEKNDELDISEEENPDVEGSLEIPLCPATINHTNGNDHEVRSYCGYELCYRENYEVAEWVAYTLTKDEVYGKYERKDNFREDPLISTGSATLNDYKKSGYDRGHLIPAADLRWSKESMNDSFLMSNITPQAADFNRKIWLDAERFVRDCAVHFGEVVVVTGPVLEKNAGEYKNIGKNKVCVPEYFYKVLLAKKKDGTYTAVGLIIPNRKCTEKFFDFAVSVDEVERRCSIDFFSALNDRIEDEIESRTLFSDWIFETRH